MHPGLLKHLSRKVSVVQRLEDAKQGLALLLVHKLMLRELCKKRVRVHALKIFLRNVHGGLVQKLVDDQHFKLPAVGVRTKVVNAAL